MKLNEERNTESFEFWMMETSIWVKCYDGKWYNQSAVNKQALFDDVLPAGNLKRASVSTRRTIKPNRMIVWQLFVGVRISLVVSPTPARAAWGLLFFKPQKTLMSEDLPDPAWELPQTAKWSFSGSHWTLFFANWNSSSVGQTSGWIPFAR